MLSVRLCAGLLALSAMAHGQADHPLTLREVLDLARSHNPNLISQGLLVDATQADEVTAGLRPNPELSIAKEDFNLSQISPLDDTLNVSQTFERGGKRKARLASARLSTVVARYGYLDFERQLLLTIKQSFVTFLVSKANLAVAQDNQRDYARTIELSRIRFSAGQISRTELDRIEIQAARFESDALNASQSMAQARTQLQALIGLDNFSPSFDISGDLNAPELKLDMEQLRASALSARPDYLGAVEQIHKAEADIRLANANGATDITAGGEYKRNGPDNFAGVTLGIPLRIFDRNQGEKLRAKKTLEANGAAERATRIQVLSDLNQAVTGYETAMRMAQLYSRDYIERARQVRDRVEFSYRNGATSLLDYIEALREYRDTEVAWHSSQAALWNAIHQLSFVAGMELTQ